MKQNLIINNEWIPNSASIQEISNNFINPIINGDIQIEKGILILRAIKKAIEDAEEKLYDDVVDAVSKYGKEGASINGAKITIKEVGVKYDFDNCQDVIWNDLTSAIKELTDKRKEREAFLKTLTKMFTYVDDETGEIITINPAIRKSTTGFVIQFAK
jgi:hypothetical protein